jgi:putative membrane protein
MWLVTTPFEENPIMPTCLTPLAALAVLAVAACTTRTDQADRQDTAAGIVAGAVAATPAAASPAAPALDDPTIVAIFDAANSADIETGQLAAERGSTKAVRDFGAMLARDHKAVRQQGRDLAQRLGVTPTPPADDPSAKAHADAMASLRSKQGAEFDRAVLDHEVQFHQGVIDAVQSTLLPVIQNQELKDLVVKIAPAFQAHRDMAASLRQKAGA